ncbi:MAG TPA: phosphoribosylanthranilate isomerase [Terracidiphilus sp.]|jgi:phosphoribosylanthranilate isomerase|nr:phosphoribosylanthranilate isomerase [Terracidiphilus sp.]
MSVWIKICGNTSLADARLAVDAGADAAGFVFAPSPRQVTVAEAASIISHLPATVEKIGVFVDASLAEIYSSVRTSGLTGVQLHFDAASEMPAKLRERLGPALRILRVLHYEPGPAKQLQAKLAEYAGNPDIDAVLVDSRTAAAAGGTGVVFDWAKARKTIFSSAGRMKLIAAGGLNPANVEEAIKVLEPWGVDVVSGVEAAPGRKDPDKVREFVKWARAAEAKE